jgi:hypothetical protein
VEKILVWARAVLQITPTRWTELAETVPAEQALMQPFIQGCGPWQPYFAAHTAA